MKNFMKVIDKLVEKNRSAVWFKNIIWRGNNIQQRSWSVSELHPDLEAESKGSLSAALLLREDQQELLDEFRDRLPNGSKDE